MNMGWILLSIILGIILFWPKLKQYTVFPQRSGILKKSDRRHNTSKKVRFKLPDKIWYYD